MSGASVLERASFDPRVRTAYGLLRALPVLGPVLGWLANRLYPHGRRIWVTVQVGLGEGLWMRLDPRYEESYRTAEYERAVQEFLVENLRGGDTFYEVGAHIGFLSLGAARLVGPEGEVVAFEADPENAARIEEHLRRNSLAQAHVVPRAVWSYGGRLRFERASSLSSRNTGAVQQDSSTDHGSEVIEVEAIALDDYIEGRRSPSLIKIDVEGAEWHVLSGAARLLSESGPLLLCEIHSAEIAREVESWLPKKGYDLQWFSNETEFPRHLIARRNSAK